METLFCSKREKIENIAWPICASLGIVLLFSFWALLVNEKFHAMGADSEQYLEIMRILQGRSQSLGSLDEVPVGVLNRTPVYPFFLLIASMFSGDDLIWLTIIANSLCTLSTTPFIFHKFGRNFGFVVVVSAYLVIAILISPYFSTISAEWLCMHLLLLMGAVFLDTKSLRSSGAGFKIGLNCSILTLCRINEGLFVLVCFLFLLSRKRRELVGFFVACIPIVLQIVLQSYIGRDFIVSQSSIVARYFLCSQLGQVAQSKSDPSLLQAFIVDANYGNLPFDDRILRESVGFMGVSERSHLYLNGVRNQDRTLEFKERFNLSFGKLNRLIAEFNKRAWHEYSDRRMVCLFALWPLWGFILAFGTFGIFLGFKSIIDEKDVRIFELIVFYNVGLIFIVGYASIFSLPVTRYVLIQTVPLFFVYLTCLLCAIFKGSRTSA